jgi:alkyl sulfatase BDS1-like metallo-beta-lactamase superfamily hydrolase
MTTRRQFVQSLPAFAVAAHMTGEGGIAWDMTRFQFLDQADEFDSVHPSMHRIGQLNN